VEIEGESQNFEDPLFEELGLQPSNFESEKKRTEQLRYGLLTFTLILMVIGPALQYYYADMFLYILAAGIAFTIGTNLTIGILSIRIEDKADLMEARMVDLLEQLSTSTDQLSEFNEVLGRVPIHTMVESIESARDELGPALTNMQDVGWGEITDAIQTTLRWVDRLDMDKIQGMVQPFVLDVPSVQILDDPFGVEAEVKEEVDFFPPPPPSHRG
jgi:hypothetical protein